nr:hypothetical protein [Acinetobacter sp. FDAARGOS_541]
MAVTISRDKRFIRLVLTQLSTSKQMRIRHCYWFGQYPNPVKKGSYDKKAKDTLLKVSMVFTTSSQGVYSTTFNYIAQKYGG